MSDWCLSEIDRILGSHTSNFFSRLKMGVQSILEEVDFDNEELAALKSSKEGAAKSRWVIVWLWRILTPAQMNIQIQFSWAMNN